MAFHSYFYAILNNLAVKWLTNCQNTSNNNDKLSQVIKFAQYFGMNKKWDYIVNQLPYNPNYYSSEYYF